MTSTTTITSDHLKAFASTVIAQIENEAGRDARAFEQVFIEFCSEHLHELNQMPEMEWVDYQRAGNKTQPGMLVHAWGTDEHQRLHLAAVLMPRQGVAEANLPYVFQRRDIGDTLQKMLNVVQHMQNMGSLPDGTAPGVDEMTDAIKEVLGQIDPEIVLHLFTPGHFRGTIPSLTMSGVAIASYLHDIEWLRRALEDTPGEQIDFRDSGGLPCLVATFDAEGEPDVLLTVLPGEFLADLYDRRRDELLRRNVRIYLRQTRKVNREMAESARTQPSRFVALNNGISAVAAGASFNSDYTRIETLDDLQIVNGGQTTATLHEVWKDRRRPVNLADLKVQAKITIIRSDTADGDEFAQKIALAANSQNRITMSDLLSGDPYERSLERISRERRYTSGGVQTGWYYERVRGQHAGLLAADRRNEKAFPTDQVIDKTHAAQYLLAWHGRPYHASLGGEKALKTFKDDMRRAAGDVPLAEATEEEFDRVVGLAILRREADGPIAAQGTMKPPLGHYLLAWLAEHHSGDIDLLQIARTGTVPERLLPIIQQITPVISRIMRTQPAAVAHESERPKRKECWEAVRILSLPGNDANPGNLRDYTRQDWQAALIWAEGKRNRVLRERLLRARKIVQTGRADQNRDFLKATMEEAIKKGFKINLDNIRDGA